MHRNTNLQNTQLSCLLMPNNERFSCLMNEDICGSFKNCQQEHSCMLGWEHSKIYLIEMIYKVTNHGSYNKINYRMNTCKVPCPVFQSQTPLFILFVQKGSGPNRKFEGSIWSQTVASQLLCHRIKDRLWQKGSPLFLRLRMFLNWKANQWFSLFNIVQRTQHWVPQVCHSWWHIEASHLWYWIWHSEGRVNGGLTAVTAFEPSSTHLVRMCCGYGYR
jgi:hypothetical protein